MKRHGYLWEGVIDFANLLAAARQAQKGRRMQWEENTGPGLMGLSYTVSNHPPQITLNTYRQPFGGRVH